MSGIKGIWMETRTLNSFNGIFSLFDKSTPNQKSWLCAWLSKKATKSKKFYWLPILSLTQSRRNFLYFAFTKTHQNFSPSAGAWANSLITLMSCRTIRWGLLHWRRYSNFVFTIVPQIGSICPLTQPSLTSLSWAIFLMS